MATRDAASATKGAAAACSMNVNVIASCSPAPVRTRRTVLPCEIVGAAELDAERAEQAPPPRDLAAETEEAAVLAADRAVQGRSDRKAGNVAGIRSNPQ